MASHGEGHGVAPGENQALAGDVDHAGVVLHAAAFEMRRKQRVEMEAAEEFLIAFEADVDQHHRIMRVADDFANDGVAAFFVAVANAHGERIFVDVFKLMDQIAALLVEKRLTVGDEELHVANLRAVDGGVIDFVEDAVGDSEPDFAGRGVGGADGVFGAGGPARLEAGRAKGGAIAIDPAVTGCVGHGATSIREN